MAYFLRIKRFLGKYYRRGKRKISDQYRKKRYRIWFIIKQVSYKSRDTKIREFDEILRTNSRVYFTTDLIKTGFTDQLIGFIVLYKLGRELGLKYYHTPLSSDRSSVPFSLDPLSQNGDPKEETGHKDIFDFLGVNDYLKKVSSNSPVSLPKILPINIDLMRVNIDDYNSLVEEMKASLRPFLKQKGPLLLTFKAGPETYFSFYRYTISKTKHNIDFRDCFEKVERDHEWRSRFAPKTIHAMVHIRQGDTATIKTPWNTYIPIWHEIGGKFTQFKNREDIQHYKSVDVEEFYKFLMNLFHEVDPARFSTVVFSDGFKKSFRWIYKYSKRKHITEEEILKLKSIEKEYEREQFKDFQKITSLETVIGEEVEKLYELIHTFLESDILIVGTQQMMLPKLMSIYCNQENMPLVIILYHHEEPHLNYIGLDPEFSVMVNLDNYSIAAVVEKIEVYLKRKGKN